MFKISGLLFYCHRDPFTNTADYFVVAVVKEYDTLDHVPRKDIGYLLILPQKE